MIPHRSSKAVKFIETESELNGNCQSLGGGAEKRSCLIDSFSFAR